jgi:putative spermidine/putrescine transport system permease protein
VFAAATREFYRWGLAGTVTGWCSCISWAARVRGVDHDRGVPLHRASLEEAAYNLGARPPGLPHRLPASRRPGLVASALLVFLYSLDEFTGTLLVGAPFVTTLPVYMYTASQGYEMQIASVTALVLMVPGAVLLLLLERFLRAEYLTFFGQI